MRREHQTPLAVRPASEGDILLLSTLDATYTCGERVLALERAGTPPELIFTMRWTTGTPRQETYAEYTEDKLVGVFARTDLFLVGTDGDAIAGLLMIIVPSWTDAGEITDLVVNRGSRRRGLGVALVGDAIDWARGRDLRALWVEPRADNAGAIDFYLTLGFRISGFNDRMYSNVDDEPGRPTIHMYRELDGERREGSAS